MRERVLFLLACFLVGSMIGIPLGLYLYGPDGPAHVSPSDEVVRDIDLYLEGRIVDLEHRVEVLEGVPPNCRWVRGETVGSVTYLYEICP